MESGELTRKLTEPAALSCPHAMWRLLRTQYPVAKVDLPGPDAGVFLVSRKADLEFVGKNPQIFSSEVSSDVWRWGDDLGPDLAPIIAEGGHPLVHTIVSSDPPRAHKYRKIALAALSPARVKARLADLQHIVDELIADIPEGVETDFRAAFTVPFPLRAIMAVYDLDQEQAPFVYDFSCALLSLVDPITPLDQAKKDLRLIVEAQKMLEPLILRYRAEPSDNFLSFIANARDDDGGLLTIAEALSVAFVTLVGGNETTRNALTSAAFVLARDRSLWEALVATPEQIDAFADEIVRYSSPATITARQTLCDTELGGTTIPAGASVLMLWGSGSHDDAAFPCPEEIRLDRPNGRSHTSFGAGVHHCAGIHLARNEIELAVRAWIGAFERMELAVPEADVQYDPVFAIRALSRLPLVLTRRRS